MSPTYAQINGFRFYFYLADVKNGEPPHAHVGENTINQSDGKIWLDPISISAYGRLSKRQMDKALKLAQDHQAEWIRIWRSYE